MTGPRSYRDVPAGVFEPSKGQGLSETGAELGYAPLDWLLGQKSTRSWWAKSERTTLGAAEVVDTALVLPQGMEGIILSMAITGKALGNGANTGTGWRLYIDRIPWLQTIWAADQAGAPILDTSGRFDYLDEGDGLGQSWAKLNAWLDENAVVEVGMNNNGGTGDPMGWVMRGAYWPITLREIYREYKKAGVIL